MRLSERQFRHHLVAPLAGAWIEIFRRREKSCEKQVAPLAGAWIEINNRIGNVGPI